jgi:hypothetical protein
MPALEEIKISFCRWPAATAAHQLLGLSNTYTHLTAKAS